MRMHKLQNRVLPKNKTMKSRRFNLRKEEGGVLPRRL
jgi:hypothetical protein